MDEMARQMVLLRFFLASKDVQMLLRLENRPKKNAPAFASTVEQDEELGDDLLPVGHC